MKKEELDKYCGYIVDIVLYDGCVACGVLEFIPTYSAKYNFRHPGFYYIGNMSFKSTEVKKIKIVEAENEDKK